MLHVPMSLIYCILPDYLNSDLQDNVRVYPLPHQEWRRTHLYSHLDPTVFKLILVEKKRMFFFKKRYLFFPNRYQPKDKLDHVFAMRLQMCK